MPRRRLILIGLLAAGLLGPAAGWAARRWDPDAPLKLEASPAVIVTVRGRASQEVQWAVTPAADQIAAGRSLCLSGPTGEYQVTAAVLSDGKLALLQTAVLLPAADQPATGEQTWALAVFDTSQQISLPAGQLALFKSQTVTAALAPLRVVWRHYDAADPAVTGSVWGIAALKLQKPALVLWRGKAIMPGYPVNLPATEADLVSLVKGAVGP